MSTNLCSWSSRNSVTGPLQPRMTIENLPPEMLLEVLSYVDQNQLVSTIPLVNQHWNTMHYDPSLYRTLTFEDKTPTTSVAVKLINIAPWLTSLAMINRTDTDELLIQVGPNHPRLKTLHLRRCRGSPTKIPVASTHLLHIISNCTQLQRFSLNETCCDGSQFYEEIGLKLPNVRRIDLGETLEQFRSGALTNIINNCNIIEVLCDQSKPGETSIPAEVVISFCDKYRESLRVLNIGNLFAWSDAAIASLAKCRNLEKINLENARSITDRGMMAISDVASLRRLSIWDANTISTQCWIAFFQKPLMRRLKKLLLESSNVDFQVMREISHLSDLEELETWNANITIEGLMSISDMPKLSALRICKSQHIPPEAWMRFLQTPLTNHLKCLAVDCIVTINDQVMSVIGSLRNLENLEVYIGNVTNDGLMAITLLPHLQYLTLTNDEHITKEGWISFYEAPQMTQLCTLTLSFCEKVDDTVACAIVGKLRSLQELYFYECKFTKQGLKSIQQQVPECCHVAFEVYL